MILFCLLLPLAVQAKREKVQNELGVLVDKLYSEIQNAKDDVAALLSLIHIYLDTNFEADHIINALNIKFTNSPYLITNPHISTDQLRTTEFGIMSILYRWQSEEPAIESNK